MKPLELLDSISREYPCIWKNIDQYRDQIRVQYPWPDNVFIHSYFGTGVVEAKRVAPIFVGGKDVKPIIKRVR